MANEKERSKRIEASRVCSRCGMCEDQGEAEERLIPANAGGIFGCVDANLHKYVEVKAK